MPLRRILLVTLMLLPLITLSLRPWVPAPILSGLVVVIAAALFIATRAKDLAVPAVMTGAVRLTSLLPKRFRSRYRSWLSGWFRRARDRGEYGEALARLDTLGRARPGGVYFIATRPLLLFESGQADLARETIMAGLRGEAVPLPRGIAFSCLGRIFTDEGRFEEAERAFNEARAHRAVHTVNVYLAICYLEQGKFPAEALDLINRAEQGARTERSSYSFRRDYAAQIDAARAWAYALMGRTKESNDARSAATRNSPSQSIIVRSNVLYYSGRARIAAGSSEEGLAEIRAAASTDPNGRAGKRAAAYLAENDGRTLATA